MLYAFFAISVFWSGDPFGSSKRLCKDFGLLFVVCLILSEKDPLEAVQAIYFRCASVLFPLSILFLRYYPKLGRAYTRAGDPMFIGVTTQKNSLGEIVLVFGLFLIWDCLDPRPATTKRSGIRFVWDRWILVAMGAWLLQNSQSKTAVACLVIGSLLTTTRLLTPRASRRMALVGGLSVPFLFFFSQQFSSMISPLVEALGRNMTFTGRTNIWDHITLATVNPVWGAGYWNFWGERGGLAIEQAMQTSIPNAHNGYIDMYIDGGCLALILLFLLLVTCGKRLIRNINMSRYQRLKFAVLIVAIVYNLSETIFLRLSPLWFTTLLAITVFPWSEEAVGTREASSVARERLRDPGRKSMAGLATHPFLRTPYKHHESNLVSEEFAKVALRTLA
jgi:O-antigen ligase